eukprot:7423109-Prorocentrum_lima.AAC.1
MRAGSRLGDCGVLWWCSRCRWSGVGATGGWGEQSLLHVAARMTPRRRDPVDNASATATGP